MSEKHDIFSDYFNEDTLIGKLHKKQIKIGMTEQRYSELWNNPTVCLTEEEMKIGWHWCDEFDGLLVGPGMDEFEEICKPSNCVKL